MNNYSIFYNIIIKWFFFFAILFMTKTDLDLLKTIRILPNFLSKNPFLSDGEAFLRIRRVILENLSSKSLQNPLLRL